MNVFVMRLALNDCMVWRLISSRFLHDFPLLHVGPASVGSLRGALLPTPATQPRPNQQHATCLKTNLEENKSQHIAGLDNPELTLFVGVSRTTAMASWTCKKSLAIVLTMLVTINVGGEAVSDNKKQ